MSHPTDATHDPGDVPGLEARLRAELGEGSLPAEARQRQLTRLQALAAELRTDAPGNGRPARATLPPTQPFVPAADRRTSDSHPPTAVAGRRPAAERARRRWFAAASSRMAAASVAVLAVLVLGTGSAVAASTDALPGEALHHVKLAVEQVRTATAWKASDEVEAYLDVAEARLQEAGRLVAGEGHADQLTLTLRRHEVALATASERADGDPQLTALVDEAASAAAMRLSALSQELPPTADQQAHDALSRAVERLERRQPSEPEGDRDGAESPTERPGPTGSGRPDNRQEPPARPDGSDRDRRREGAPARPADPGQPGEPERAPEDTGQPAEPGRPEDTGRSQDAGRPPRPGAEDQREGGSRADGDGGADASDRGVDLPSRPDAGGQEAGNGVTGGSQPRP